MKATLGYALVLGGLAFASFGALVGLVSGMRRNDAAFPWVLRCVYGFAACMVGANLVMEWALLTNDFSVQYVAENNATTNTTNSCFTGCPFQLSVLRLGRK